MPLPTNIATGDPNLPGILNATNTAVNAVETEVNDLQAVDLRGTGSPEGVVTALPGAGYTDTAITNGALRWAKFTGTGNTGWRVISGDTGWRLVAGLLNSAWSPQAGTYVKIRRVNETVHIGFSLVNVPAFSGAVNTNLFAAGVPAGFAPATAASWSEEDQVMLTPAGVFAANFFLRSSTLTIYTTTNYAAGAGLFRHSTRYVVSDQWPTTLPGTSV